MNGVFVLFEGVGSTIFASQVSRHVHDMRRAGINMRVLALEPNRKNMEQSRKNIATLKETDPELDVVLYRCISLFLPFSMIINTCILWLNLRHMNARTPVDFIHARADYCTCLCLLQNLFRRCPIIWDCRGDSYAELENLLDRRMPKLLWAARWYFLWRQSLILAICCRLSTRALFVSTSLRDIFTLKNTQQAVVVPCTVASELFFYSKDIRKAVRAEWGVPDAKIILLYAGGLAAYQGLQRLQACFELHSKNTNVQLVMVTPNIQAAKAIFPQHLQEKVLFKSAQYKEMNGVYNAADVGILLRDTSPINNVASPTKFGEYSMTGLPVLSNDTVEQVKTQSRNFGNLVHANAESLERRTDEDRHLISQKATLFYGRKSGNSIYHELYHSLVYTCQT